jgi:hypothetical protein
MHPELTATCAPASLPTVGETHDQWLEQPCKRIGVIAASVGRESWADADGGLHAAGSASGRLTDSPAARDPRERSGLRLAPGHARTLAALERAFPVRFEQLGRASPNNLDGVIVLGPHALAESMERLPRLVLPAQPTLGETQAGPTTTHDGAEQSRTVALSEMPCIARPLRGRAIHETVRPDELSLAGAGGAVLATVDGRPVWRRQGERGATLAVSAYALAQLHDGQALREQLQGGRFMGLLPLVHFIGELLGENGWTAPPLRASFVVDDPNLHWTSYGFLDYAELIEHAKRHGYHMGFATVPLDGWFVHRRAAALLAENASALSLLVHGNDHVARELGRLSTDAAAEAAIAQGLRRIAALESRAGVAVERVMAPPHGACSEAALRALFRLGGEAACISRPYPWRDGQPAPTPLAGWRPAELVAGGLPVLPRHPLSASREDLALRALLGQPLILYGHHNDFADGLDVLAQAASEINSLGDVRWGSLGWIARGNYATRRVGELLLVRMHARRIVVKVPAGVRALRVVADEPFGGSAGHRLTHAAGSLGIAFARGSGASELLELDGRATRVDLTLKADLPLSPEDVRSRAISPWALVRRALVETRDRLQPLR